MIVRLLLFLLSAGLLIFIIIQKKVRKWKKAGLILASLILVLFTGFRYLIPLLPPPEPTGNMEVLTDMIFYRYKSEIPEMLTHVDEREVPVKVWYPKGAKENELPLLIFSPGSFGTENSNETLFLELASRGYMVMGFNHPYHSFSSKMSDGSSIGVDFGFINELMSSPGSKELKSTLKSLNKWTDVRIDDINIVLDKILDTIEDNDYEKYIDRNRIVLSGHSLGGSAALAVGRQKADYIRALVILESPFAKDIVGIDGNKYVFTDAEYPLPILHLYSDALYSNIDEIPQYGMNARLMKSDNPMYVNVHIEGVGHLGLTDMVLISPILTNMFDGGLDKRHAPKTLLELNEYVLKFLEKYNK